MGVREQVGRPHEEEEAGVDREQAAEPRLRDRERRADDRSGERRRRVDREPADRAGAVTRLAHDEADRVQAVCEVVRDHRDEDEQPGLRREPERQPDPEAVDEAVHGEAGRAERADLGVRVDVRVVVAVMEDERPLGEEEEDEAGPDERPDELRVVDRLDRLRQHIEERDGDDDAAGERDRSRQLPRQPERDDPSGSVEASHPASGMAIQFTSSAAFRSRPAKPGSAKG